MAESIAISLEVDDKGSVVVKKFTSGTVNSVKKMTDKSIGHVKRLSARFAKGLGGAISGIGKALLNLKVLAVGALVGWGFKTLIQGFIDTGSKMDQLKISLDTITKGKGLEWFEKLNKWAMTMPVNTEKAIESFIMMRAMGLDPTINQMTVLVDTMSALGGKADTMEGIARALGQIQTKGKVSAEELMQLAERGVPVFEILREKFGDVETSSIDAKAAIAAIFEGLEERFGGQAEKIQGKWSGLIETLKSYWTEFKRLVMDSKVMAALELGVGSVVKKLDEMYQTGKLKEWANVLGIGIVNTMANVVEAISKVPLAFLKLQLAWLDFKVLLAEVGLLAGKVGVVFAALISPSLIAPLGKMMNSFSDIIKNQDTAAAQIEQSKEKYEGYAKKIKGVADEIRELAKITPAPIKISVKDLSSSVLRRIQSEIANIKSKTVTIRVVETFTPANRYGPAQTDMQPYQNAYAIGTAHVPQTGVYLLHQGEKVIPKKNITDKTRQTAGVNFNGDIIINIPDPAAPQSAHDWRYITREKIIPELKAAVYA